jgi:putative colanic acid biosynthesis acetyltransferase WcaF
MNFRKNRSVAKYTHQEMVYRLFWFVGNFLFRYSPRPLFSWRRLILRLFGARVGKEVHIYNSAKIYFPWNFSIGDWSAIGENALIYNLGPVSIGSEVTVSQRVHLCAGTHDYTDPSMPLLKPAIVVKDNVWICADAFVGPGITVGAGSVVGAASVVMSDVPAWKVVAGNPAKVIKDRVLRDK